MSFNNPPKVIVLLIICIILSSVVYSQKKITVSGFISDSESGERLAGASVYSPEENNGTISNEFGYFSISVNSTRTNLIFRFVGYNPYKLSTQDLKDTFIYINLATNNNIKEVEVLATSKANFLQTTMGLHRLNAKQIERVPVVFGEPDLLKVIQLLPGVTFSTEGSSAFSVRGGNPDQTLIQLDGVPVYNVNHLWGFMSAFNNDAVSHVYLYKGNLPARFGGRMGSVLDVRMKEGNQKKAMGTFSISPVAGRFTFEGPL